MKPSGEGETLSEASDNEEQRSKGFGAALVAVFIFVGLGASWFAGRSDMNRNCRKDASPIARAGTPCSSRTFWQDVRHSSVFLRRVS